VAYVAALLLHPMGQCFERDQTSTTAAPQTRGMQYSQTGAARKDAELTLDEIAKAHRTDKSSKYHNYAQFYDQMFYKLRGSDINLLEVGVGTCMQAPSSMKDYKCYKPGASLRMWSEYFSCAGMIAGIDTQADCMFQEGNIRTALADSRCAESVTKAVTELGTAHFDIIVDDGLHEQDAQVETATAMIEFLSPNGVYVIEDIRRPRQLLPKLKLALPNRSFHVESLAKLNPKKRLPDSNLIVILPGQPEQAPEGTLAHVVKSILGNLDDATGREAFEANGGK